MVYGFPVGMLNIPQEWFSQTGGYLFPIDEQSRFKMRFSYQRATDKEKLGLQFPCNARDPQPYARFFETEYVIVKTERTE